MEVSVCRRRQNLSVSARTLNTMITTTGTTTNTRETNTTKTSQPQADGSLGSNVFADPVAYLASFGMDSELVAALILPAAA